MNKLETVYRQITAKIVKVFVLCVFAVSVLGCQQMRVRAYSGPELSKDKVATILGGVETLLVGFKVVGIVSVDDKELVPYGRDPATTTEVLPGSHTLVPQMVYGTSLSKTRKCSARFVCDLVAGETYQITILPDPRTRVMMVVALKNNRTNENVCEGSAFCP